MESTPLAAQQAAIQEARARYERGEISFETFRRALDALVLAQNADECQAILHELPSTPLASLNALDVSPLQRNREGAGGRGLLTPSTPQASAPLAPSADETQRIIAFMSSTRKTRHTWRLAPKAQVISFMGDVTLDLSMAELPPHATLHVAAIMGAVTIYVPRNLRVRVSEQVIMGDISALGESTSGVITFGHEEHAPASEPARAALEIEAFVLMGNVRVALTDGRPMISVSELVRDALQAAAEGMRRGLTTGTSPRPQLETPDAYDAERRHLAGPATTPHSQD